MGSGVWKEKCRVNRAEGGKESNRNGKYERIGRKNRRKRERKIIYHCELPRYAHNVNNPDEVL